MTSVVLILGSGPRIGAAVAKAFADAGHHIVIAARKGTDTKTDEGYLSIKADFADPTSIPGVFTAVRTNFGFAPSIVIYNAAALTVPEKDSVLSVPAEQLTADMNTNTISPYVAAQEALRGWATLTHGPKLFIYTGNASNKVFFPMPATITLGMGKCATAWWIGQADTAYAGKGYRFIYADERHEDGKIKGMQLDGPAHGVFYTQLAKSTDGVPWNATFVKGKGYVAF